jgi:hypothetical protein
MIPRDAWLAVADPGIRITGSLILMTLAICGGKHFESILFISLSVGTRKACAV